MTLPFGASASVLGFNWVAAGIEHILTNTFLIGASSFYDDFTIIELDSVAEHTGSIVDGVFALLGWALKPLPPFMAKAS